MVEVKGKVKALAKYPLVFTTTLDPDVLSAGQLAEAGRLSRAIESDMKSPVLALPPLRNAATAELNAYAQKLGGWQNVVQSLTKADGSPAEVSITLLSGAAQRQLTGAYSSPLETWPFVELRNGTYQHAVAAQGDVRGRTRSDPPGDVQLGKFPAPAPFHFHFYKSQGGPIDVDLRCEDTYTAVRMIQGLFGPTRLDGGAWIAPVSPDRLRMLWLKLVFPKPPPSRNEWPTRDSLELGY